MEEEMIKYFERVIRFKDFEAWDVKFRKRTYRVFIIDENRPITKNDLVKADQEIWDDDFDRDNFVSVKIFSEKPVKGKHIPHLVCFFHQLTDFLALAHCEVYTTFHNGNLDDALNLILKEKYDIRYEDIPLKNLMHFNQDIR